MANERKIMRLIKNPKHGLARIVFSRFAISVLLILFQLGILLVFYSFFYEYFRWFYTCQVLFSIVMLFYLLNMDMDANAKITWLVLMSIFPFTTTILLWFMQRDIGNKFLKDRVNQNIQESKKFLLQDETILEEETIVNSATKDLHRYINRNGCFPIYKNTKVDFYSLGEYKFEAMLEDLKKAEKFIFLEYFIISEGIMWGSILKILAEKAKQGVDVRVMYDGLCDFTTLTSDYSERLNELGIKCKAFSPITPFITTAYNYRDHRKILVIDGKVAFNGGVNLADEYINTYEKYGHWKDTAIRLEGEAVQSFTLMFLQMWNITEESSDWYGVDVKGPICESQGYVMPYAENPMCKEKVAEMVYVDILNRARKYVHIMTPYLILDNELENALTFAALRGVDVKIILPGIPDKKGPYALAKSHYKKLVKNGVKIYEYTPGFVHAKIFVSDDIKGVVGTINLDYRSLYHHFECATYLYGVDCISQIEKDFQDTLKKCKRVTKKTIRKEKLYYKIAGGFLKQFASLM